MEPFAGLFCSLSATGSAIARTVKTATDATCPNSPSNPSRFKHRR